MHTTPKRLAQGFAVAVLSVITIHQGIWGVLHMLDLPNLGMPPAYPLSAVPPFGVPRLVSLCFWGGLWGAAYAVFWRGSWPIGGLCLGLAAILAGYFVAAPLKGIPIANVLQLHNWLRSLLINLPWAFTVAYLTRHRPADA